MNDETVALRRVSDYFYRTALWLGIMAEERDAGKPIPAHQRRDVLAALDAVEEEARVARSVIARLR